MTLALLHGVPLSQVDAIFEQAWDDQGEGG
jgi:hypothetical protein